MPVLSEHYLDAQQSEDAKQILIASSLTYFASSLLSVMNIWPWLGRMGPTRLPVHLRLQNGLDAHPVRIDHDRNNTVIDQPGRRDLVPKRRARIRTQAGVLPVVVRIISKPIVRSWFCLRWGL